MNYTMMHEHQDDSNVTPYNIHQPYGPAKTVQGSDYDTKSPVSSISIPITLRSALLSVSVRLIGRNKNAVYI